MIDAASFESLLDDVLEQWPAELRIGELDWTNTGKHYVFGLNRLAGEISSKYIGRPDEILMRTMSDAIFDGVHGFALFCDPVRPALLRRDFLKRRFEARLRGTILIGTGLRWSDVDVALAEAYLDNQANKETDAPRDTPSVAPDQFFPIKGAHALLNREDGSVWEIDNG